MYVNGLPHSEHALGASTLKLEAMIDVENVAMGYAGNQRLNAGQSQ